MRKDRISDPQGQWLEGNVIFGFRQMSLGMGEKEKSWSGDQEDEAIDNAGEIEHWDPEKCGRRRDMHVTKL